ncbi:L-asparaginase-like [Paramacrobiotus metropolitanus]|uniref:L-asparaginase-like n=1 Tax=Paramacrobiotus metropolitanus TaxID=2943436 RepID=UPI0024462556|nr:L-asparaginase-like [Paramacrobiotus metropolitanus]XP_055327661.1 L-asparaginase-like [Paramacrobiotus metropolitanus]XP_055327662.1 L-asparaginase-like [Paramacrobiotus metropolitanus]XP_055327663.1 L-asparaginase-like [Paramacrobiotus metropolitanus]
MDKETSNAELHKETQTTEVVGKPERKRHPSMLEEQISIFNSLEYDPQKHARVLVLYTGGTIGMCWKNGAYCPEPNFLVDAIKRYPHLHDSSYATVFTPDVDLQPLVLPDCHEPKTILYYVKEYDPLLDSSNMTAEEWSNIAKDIYDQYEAFDGFVILHGTDTMSYTASALSFMLENLGKPVILTGSQIPIFEVRSDGRDNFIGALVLAGCYKIPEVCIYFNHKLLRGNRSTKVDNSAFDAFDSPNMKPIASVEIKIYVDTDSIFRPHKLNKFAFMTNMIQNVAVLRLFPSITASTVKYFLRDPIAGVVLQTYGAGNGPQKRKDILDAFREATDRGVLIINISQCSRGVVNPSYETGQALLECGIIPGHDMTPEAALAKLSYVLGKTEWDYQQKRAMILQNLRGELTVKQSRQLSIIDADLIEAVAQVMQVSSSEEMAALRRVLYPSLICNATRSGSIATLESLKSAGANLRVGDYDGNTALHIAATNGLVDVVKFLIDNGANIFAEDQWGYTALDNAVRFDRFEIIRILRAAGAHLKQSPTKIASELCYTAAKDEVDRLRSFYFAGANLDQEDYNGCTALLTAVRHRSVSCVKFLVGVCESSISQKDRCGFTPYSEAERMKDKDLMYILSHIPPKIKQTESGGKLNGSP